MLKNAPACADASAGRQMRVEPCEIPLAEAPEILLLLHRTFLLLMVQNEKGPTRITDLHVRSILLEDDQTLVLP